jgi:hypothetical protein
MATVNKVSSGVRAARCAGCAAATALLFTTTALCASQPLPPRGGSPQLLAVPGETLPVQPPPATALPGSVIDATRADLLKRLAASTLGTQPELMLRESVVWADGSLGCAKPGERYTMAQVPGWRLVWRMADRDWAYHASTRGAFVYCEHPRGQGNRGEGAGPTTGEEGIRGRLPTK